MRPYCLTHRLVEFVGGDAQLPPDALNVAERPLLHHLRLVPAAPLDEAREGPLKARRLEIGVDTVDECRASDFLAQGKLESLTRSWR